MPLIWELLNDLEKLTIKANYKRFKPPEPKKHDAFALIEPIEEIAEIMEERSAVEV